MPVATQTDVDLAVKHARKAFKTWSKVPFSERAKLLLDFADAIEAHREPLERLLVLEQGKPVGLAKTEFDMALQWRRAFSTMEVMDEILDGNEERTVTQIFAPLGNTIIIKPSPFTSYCDLKLGEIGMGIFPPGVLQVLSGGDDLGPMLTEHPDIDKPPKRVTLEVGGNDAAIICEDVDIAAIVPEISTLAFLNSGQNCMLIKPLYHVEFAAALVAFSKGIKTGDGFAPDVPVGPVQNAMQYGKVKGLYSEIEKCSWTQALKGEVLSNSKGFFITPIPIIDNPPDDSWIVVQEPLGLILPMLKWSDEEDALRRANDTKAGLGVSVWSKDLDRAERMARCLSAGSVWINSHFDVAPTVPFGGHKWSGIGREWGMTGLQSYSNSTSLWKWKKAM
ncbi:hypothetical protein ASPCAL13242 [Aspergillus calidoustus]|uniref:aldehyde dehydrogenase (NAD(+)) n=1 Tax=Aspergillus calidoustus TaxID=454130 RepID=A0A0U4ZKJ9_ASPCI|nr:hypothetical protein ASPCAL13242 [Aspergillus calidoustus]